MSSVTIPLMAVRRRATMLLAALCVCAACSTLRPDPGIHPSIPTEFSHGRFDRVLRRFVDGSGHVDYAALKRDRDDLALYFALIAQVSPDSHPELFQSAADRLAFWINAYNAAVISAVVEAYPISSVGDVGLPTMKVGFFVLQSIYIGGKRTNLYDLENAIVRKRFRDPRIHFALNCASASCPRLANRAFEPATLDRRLDEEARAFVNDRRNVRIDHQLRTVHLSAIFDWYESDFIDWPRDSLPPNPSLLDYLALYAAPALADDLERSRTYRIHFDDYDWSLNDQAAR